MKAARGEEHPALRAPALREHAILSARERFLHWGYSGTSIATIAEDLRVTKAALYYHFPDKEALFLAVFDDYLEGVAADLAAIRPLFELESREALAAFEALARIFLSRGEASVRMDRLAFQESPHLSEAGRASLGERYHRDLVRPLEGCFDLAERASWIRPRREGESARVWHFMGQLSAYFALGHEASGTAVRDAAAIAREAAAFSFALLYGIGRTGDL